MLGKQAGIVMAVALGTLWSGTVMPAIAGPGGGTVVCPPIAGPCSVIVGEPGRPGEPQPPDPSGEEPTGDRSPCTDADDKPVPCTDPIFGTWNQADHCYYRPVDPQPSPDNPVWEGRFPQGAIFQATCPGVVGTGGGWRWLPSAPGAPGGGPPISPAVLAQQAIDRLPLTGPAIGMTPRPGTLGLVGLPVWMWTEVSPATWGPASATASVPGLSVTATAQATQIVWAMGDGHSVSCRGPGTPYLAEFGNRMSPTCGYRYSLSSAREAGGAFRITATTTWDVRWSGGGASGQATVTRTSATTARIGEMQVLVD